MTRFFVALALLLLSLPATAQDRFDAHGFYLAPDDGDLADPLVTWRPEAQTPGGLGVLGLFEYAKAPLILVPVSETSGADTLVLDDLFGLNLAVHAGLHERIALAVSVPIWFASTGPDGPQGVAFGDTRVDLPVTLLALDGTRDSSAGLSVVPFADLPTGATRKFLGNEGMSAGLLVVGAYAAGSFQVAGNVGLQVTPNIGYVNLHGGDKALVNLGVGYVFTDWLAAHLEGTLRAPLTRNTEPLSETPAEVILSLRGRHDYGLSWNAGGSVALTRGASAAVFRIFAGVGWRYGKDGGQVLFAADPDDDDIKGPLDACPEEPETLNNYLDEDGCPDALAKVRFLVFDPDGDPLPGAEILVDSESVGVTDLSGALELPRQPPGVTLTYEVRNDSNLGYEPTILGSIDLEPGDHDERVDVHWMPGAIKIVARGYDGAELDATVTFSSGAETYDRQISGSGPNVFVLPPDDWTLVVSHPFYGTMRKDVTIRPDQTSLLELRFVLEKPMVRVTEREVVILQQILFAFDSADIEQDSLPILDQVSNSLLQHPEIEKVEIQGHTDSKGGAEYNRDLSQRRMESVVEYLVGQGVDPATLLPVGYGEACPIADNDTDEGREQNRRVQFFILDPEPKEPVPCHADSP